MSYENMFSLVNLIAMLMWLVLIIFPYKKPSLFLRKYRVVPLLLSIIYAIYISLSLYQGGGMDFSSLASVMELFTQEQAVLAGWVHYLAFDLLVGMWILDENEKHRLPHLIIVPCLLLTFMLGPIGFLLFSIIKTFKAKQNVSN